MRNALKREQIAECVVRESGDESAFSLIVNGSIINGSTRIFNHILKNNPEMKKPLRISYCNGIYYRHDWLTYKVTMPASEDIKEVYLGIKNSIEKLEGKFPIDVFNKKVTRLDNDEYIFPLGFSGEYSVLPKSKHLEVMIENGVIHFSHLLDSEELVITSCLDLSDLMIDHMKTIAPSKHYIKNPAVIEQIKQTYMYNPKLENLVSAQKIRIK